MSLVDTYHGNINRKRQDIAKLQTDKSKEQQKVADFAKKISDLSHSLSRTRNASLVASKSRQIERCYTDSARAEKRVAEIERKIATKQKELNAEQRKLSAEEEKKKKKQIAETKKGAKDQERRLAKLNQTVTEHDLLHVETLSMIKRLESLPEQVTVLFLAANPITHPQLRLDEEARAIAETIRKSDHRDSVRFETRWAVRPLDVLQAVNELKPAIVHFSGHGSEADEIIFQDDKGQSKPVRKEAIVQTLVASSDSIRLVFFNTCYSYNQAKAVTNHVEAAIGMNSDIGDVASRIFSSQFYSSIGFGLSVKKSFEQAKAMLMMESITDENIPELFIRDDLRADEIVIVRPLKPLFYE